ncbi:EamA family transporter [Herbiconiux liangxiaofengii]|uniref:EamA family transporter n=1 Tax=Herbiconiux liangxiaofengii TaxID=3342795 RepID=UPI0035B99A4E
MLSALLGLVGGIVYGGADFLGGLAARRLGAVRVTVVSAFSGLVLLLAAYPFVGGMASAEAVGLGALSGLAGAAAIALLYGCLALGPMSILSPLTAVVSALVPFTIGLLGGERLPLLGWLAIALALVAVVLVGFVPEKGAARPRPLGLAMAVGAGALIGVFLVLLDRTPPDSGLVPLLLNRSVSTAVMLVVLAGVLGITAVRRARSTDAPRPPKPAGAESGTVPRWAERAVLLAIACGLVDALANLLLLLALRAGELTVVSVLTALYPAGTVILAAMLLRERVAAVQVVGLVLAFVAAALLALA